MEEMREGNSVTCLLKVMTDFSVWTKCSAASALEWHEQFMLLWLFFCPAFCNPTYISPHPDVGEVLLIELYFLHKSLSISNRKFSHKCFSQRDADFLLTPPFPVVRPPVVFRLCKYPVRHAPNHYTHNDTFPECSFFFFSDPQYLSVICNP